MAGWRHRRFSIRTRPGKDKNLEVLAEVLQTFYGEHHNVLAYKSPMLVIGKPIVTRTPIAMLAEVDVGSVTLYVPPLRLPDTNTELARRLGF